MSAVDTRLRVFGRRDRRLRDVVTPEGVPLPVEIAGYGERATAFAIDMFIWFCASLLVLLTLVVLLIHGMAGVIATSVLLFIAFVVRNLYFIYFELNWQGVTPGKRIVGLRVVDRLGGPLLPSAVIARNLIREIEVFIPLGLLISIAAISSWGQLALAGWLLCFSALPLFNRDRMRAGDLIAGTMVIALPRQQLSGDLIAERARFAFTDRQLRAYGAFELQVLEELLRRPDSEDAPQLLADVAEKIRRKIGWKGDVGPSETLAFLRDFYTAQRGHLEREQLFGRARADKHHAGTN